MSEKVELKANPQFREFLMMLFQKSRRLANGSIVVPPDIVILLETLTKDDPVAVFEIRVEELEEEE